MKPKLVDLNEIFKDNSSLFFKNEPVIKNKVKPKKNINYKFNYNSLFNFLGLIGILIGIYFLHRRKRDKEKRKDDFEGRIYKLKDIIKNNDEFIL
tara:strand:- start:10 stop:294 length:285 start_codon:yes stop_codon:yes gene_type:complete